MTLHSAAVLAIALIALLPGCGQRELSNGRDALTISETTVANLTRPRIARRSTIVRSGDNLQKAINSAKPGDRIILEAGATFTGPFSLPRKSGQEWIVIQSSALEQLPPAGSRVSPRHASLMPVLEAAEGSVLTSEEGAHHFWFLGVEIRPARATFLHNLVELGANERSIEELPHHIVFERCYLHGDPERGSRRGIAMNSRSTAVKDSYLSDFKEAGADSQAIAGWNGSGPFAIVNSYLEAAGENLLFGGADPWIHGLVPSRIEIRRNHFSKPLSWKEGDPAYAGTQWTVKNLLELKNARHVLIDGNLFEHNWPQSQNGFAVLFTVRNQDGAAPWSTVEDVTFTNNVVRRVGAGINILGRDNVHASGPTRRIRITNNLFHDIGGPWGNGRLFQFLDGTSDVTIEHNTALNGESFLVAEPAPHTGFVFRNNIVQHQQYGLIGADTGTGVPTLQQYFPDAVMIANAIVGGQADRYPPGNFFPASIGDLKFLDSPAGNYRLAPASPLRKAGTDGRDVGVDVDMLEAAQSARQKTDADAASGPHRAQMIDSGALTLALLRSNIPSARQIATAVFWISLALIVYVCFGYPLTVAVWAALRPKPLELQPFEPAVSVVIAAHNEAPNIKQKVKNLLALDYPGQRLEIMVGSDGSTDGTLERLREMSETRIRLFVLSDRQGKPAVLNKLIPKAAGEIVVLSDVRQQFDPQLLRNLIQPFADPRVGAVSGELILTCDPTCTAVGDGVGAYWRFEKFVRSRESRIDSTVGATGAVYAIRKSLFEPIPEDTILDDVLIPLIVTRRGYRVVFEPRARAFDVPPETSREEFTRKVRTIAGNFQLFARESWLFNPIRNRLWLQTISHKALRLLLPLLQVVLVAANLALAGGHVFYVVALMAQTLFYAGAAIGWILQRRQRKLWPMTFPFVFCLLSCATVVAFTRHVAGRQTVLWDKAGTA